MKHIVLEVCCGSAEDVFAAKQVGADRVELNAAMFLGGLTPSIGAMQVAKQTGMEIMAMVRPRGGGFCYTDMEFETMLRDTEALLEAGAQGIVFGILLKNGNVDVPRCERMMQAIGGRQSVFHRAFDVTPHWQGALDALCGLGVTRILTSGQAINALEGIDVLSDMIAYAAGRIEILPGAGIRPNNAAEIIRRTDCTQIHASLSKQCFDVSTAGNPAIHFGAALYPPENVYTCMDARQFQTLHDLLQAE